MALVIALILGAIALIVGLVLALKLLALVIGLAVAVFVYFVAEKLVGQGR